MLRFSVPPQLILGQLASLECNFDMEGLKLYSEHGTKMVKNSTDTFDVARVNIDGSIFKH